MRKELSTLSLAYMSETMEKYSVCLQTLFQTMVDKLAMTGKKKKNLRVIGRYPREYFW